jgi:hypothetical protein
MHEDEDDLTLARRELLRLKTRLSQDLLYLLERGVIRVVRDDDGEPVRCDQGLLRWITTGVPLDEDHNDYAKFEEAAL